MIKKVQKGSQLQNQNTKKNQLSCMQKITKQKINENKNLFSVALKYITRKNFINQKYEKTYMNKMLMIKKMCLKNDKIY